MRTNFARENNTAAELCVILPGSSLTVCEAASEAARKVTAPLTDSVPSPSGKYNGSGAGVTGNAGCDSRDNHEHHDDRV
jgi:hypothetical protein